MNPIQIIAKNTAALLASRIVSFILGFFFIVYTTRYLGTQGFGILSFALAFTSIVGMLTDFGLSALVVREVARDKSMTGKYLGNTLAMKVVLIAFSFGLIAAIIHLLGYPEHTIKVVYIIAVSVFFTAFSNSFLSIFNAYEKMEYVSIGLILNQALMVLGLVFVIHYDSGVLGCSFIYFFANAVCLIYCLLISIWKFDLPGIEVDWHFCKSIIKSALPFFMSAAFSVIAFRIDIVMISMMKGDVDVGLYSAAYKLLEVLMFIPATFVGAIYPVLSKLYVASRESLAVAYKKYFKFLYIIGLPIAVGVTFLADKIILLIYNSGFSGSIIALRILIWTIPIIFLTFMFGTMLAAINRQGLVLKILFVCMSFNIIANMILIPKFSYVGASAATVITEMLSFILCYHFLSKFICKASSFKIIIKPILSSTAMGIFIICFSKMDLFLLIFISIIIYFIVLVLLKTFSREDFDLLKQFFAK